MSAPEPETTTVRVAASTKARLEKIQQEFRTEHPGGTITVDGVIRGMLDYRDLVLLADRKPVQP